MNTQTFQYWKSCSIDYKGCFFHSLTELKYALMIEEEFAFLREGIEIYYDPVIQQSTLYIHEQTKKYTPDFLTRNWNDHKAYLVEIKPKGFNNYEQLNARQKISQHFIKTYKYDWEYKVVYSDEIILSEIQQRKFDSLKNNNLYRAEIKIQKLFDGDSLRNCFSSVPDFKNTTLTKDQYRFFVRKGRLPAEEHS